MEILELREKFDKAEKSELNCNELHSWLEENASNNPLFLGYLGATKALKAKFVWNPLSKLYHIQQASKNLEQALKSDSTNLEVRFLRFSIEYNIPSFLGYSNHIQDDLDFIAKNLVNSVIDIEMQIKIAQFLLKTGRCNLKQKLTLENFIENS